DHQIDSGDELRGHELQLGRPEAEIGRATGRLLVEDRHAVGGDSWDREQRIEGNAADEAEIIREVTIARELAALCHHADRDLEGEQAAGEHRRKPGDPEQREIPRQAEIEAVADRVEDRKFSFHGRPPPNTPSHSPCYSGPARLPSRKTARLSG